MCPLTPPSEKTVWTIDELPCREKRRDRDQIGMNRTLIVVQCRFNSSRLPGKALHPVGGLPMIVFLLRRLRGGLDPREHRVVLATTRNRRDDIVESWALEEGVDVVRGEEADVLGRFICCLDAYPSETIVRVTGDNPLTCPEMLKWLVREKQDNSLDYVQCENLPYGAGVDVFSSDLMKTLDREATEEDEREHINLYLLRNSEKFKIRFPKVHGELARPDIRVTVDTKEDWLRVRALFGPTETEPWKLSIDEAIKRMDARSP